jgi:hypothetical protein
MPVSTPPAAPNRNDPSGFPAAADAFVAWLIASVPEFNALSLMTASGTFNVGAVATPSIAFTGDPNTGFYWVGADQIGMATNAVRRVLLSTTAMQIDLPITGTAVQSSAVDTTAGRMMAVGAFGLGAIGSVPLLAALDATTIPDGDARYDATTTGTYPAGVTAANLGTVSMFRATATSGFMVLQPANSNLMYVRRLATTWQAWQQCLTVPDAGVAEGDLLYRNATGWVRLAKGAAYQVLTQNAGLTAPEWATPVGGFGESQTWQNVLGSRVNGTSYQNLTAQPIEVAISGSGGSGTQVMAQASANGSTWIDIAWRSDASNNIATFTVPVNWYYRTQNLSSLSSWAELRA